MKELRMPDFPWHWGESTWQILEHVQTLWEILMMGITIVGVPWGLAKKDSIRRWLYRNSFPRITEDFSEVRDQLKEKGIVFTLSHAEIPIWMIEQINPVGVGMVVTEKSEEVAKRIKEHFRDKKIYWHISPVVDPDNPESAKQETSLAIKRLSEHCHIDESSIGVDVTGGKVPMSLGAFMAAEEARATTLYVTSEFDPALKKIRPGTQKPLLISKPKSA